MKNKLYILSFAVVLIGIGVLSLMPPSSGIELGEHDKWNHFIAYLVLSLNWSLIENKSKVFWIGIIACFLYGMLLEYLQGFVPGRESSIMDALANTGGIGTGSLIGYIIKFNKSNQY
jgi:VanZ family protein